MRQFIDTRGVGTDVIDDDRDDREPEHAGDGAGDDQQDRLDLGKSQLRSQEEDHGRLDDARECKDD